MRLRNALVAGMLGMASAGCGEEFLGNSLRNFVVAPDRATDERALECRSARWADEAWKQLCREDGHGERSHSPDYEDGFKRGFVDYVTRGGNGNPPAVPPIRYQQFGELTVPGERNEKAQEWFAGFRAGAAEAVRSGYRGDVVIPLASPPVNAVEDRPTLAENAAANPLTTPAPQAAPAQPGYGMVIFAPGPAPYPAQGNGPARPGYGTVIFEPGDEPPPPRRLP